MTLNGVLNVKHKPSIYKRKKIQAINHIIQALLEDKLRYCHVFTNLQCDYTVCQKILILA